MTHGKETILLKHARIVLRLVSSDKEAKLSSVLEGILALWTDVAGRCRHDTGQQVLLAQGNDEGQTKPAANSGSVTFYLCGSGQVPLPL